MTTETQAETTTYTMPAIPFNDLDDFRPGRGLDSVQELVADLRATYSAMRVRTHKTDDGIQFTVTGPVDGIRRLAALYGD